jgi:hypothetical protein
VKVNSLKGVIVMTKDLQINPRIVEQLSKATVKNLVDGIVELVTNCDDSYKRLEDEGQEVSGEIKVCVNRKKGGICERLIVKDFAAAMTKEQLEKAIEFAGVTSGFEEGRSVRGLFGRGLKETIIALGDGEIKTIKNGKECKTRLWFDKKLKKPQYDDELLENIKDTQEKNGTEITINITNEKIKIPEYENFKEQLSKHYALRDINGSKHRNISLSFDDLRRRSKFDTKITFSHPEGKKIREEEIKIHSYGDKVKVVIYESPTSLDSPRNNPFGLAGILIKTKGAILDNQLFRFDNDPSGLYFFGETICEGLEERLRKGETEIIDLNRNGLEWRHEYCHALARVIEKVLEPYVLEKRKSLEKKPEKEVKEQTNKMLKKLCSLLNELAKQELEDLPPIIPEPGLDIVNLVIKPEVANIQKDKPHTFSVYAPDEIVNLEGQEVHIKSDSIDIQPLASTVKLEKHPKYPEKLWYRYFKVVGKQEDAQGTLTVNLGKETAQARIKVAPPKERKKGEITTRKGGFISGIEPDNDSLKTGENQRVFYENETGIIWINIKFPSIEKFIKSGFEGVETPEGKVLIAELVGEAFCKRLAFEGMERSKYLKIPGAEIESFNTAMYELQKKYLYRIQEIIFAWKFS